MNIVNLYFISSFIQHSGDHLGENPQFVYFQNNLVSLAGATVLFAIIFGLLTILISNIISMFLHKNLAKKATETYPHDKVIYIFHPSIISISIAEFYIGGGFIGGYIIPFFVFNNIGHIDMVTRQNLFIYTIAGVGVLLICILFKSYTLILTNKRIIGLSYGGLVRNTLLSFGDIKAINKAFGGWEIISKDDAVLPLKCHTKAKMFYKKLKQLLKMENI